MSSSYLNFWSTECSKNFRCTDIRQAEVELFLADRRTDTMKVTVTLALLCDMPNELSDEQIKIASGTKPYVVQCTEFKLLC